MRVQPRSTTPRRHDERWGIQLAASVNDVGTAIGLAGIGWGTTIAPLLTPSGTSLPVSRIPIADVGTVRHSALIVRGGDHLSSYIAAGITSVREVGAQRWRREPALTGNPLATG